MNRMQGFAEIRALTESEEMIIEGYALKFGQPTQPKFKEYYGYTEIIGSRALDGVDLSDVPLKYNHSDQKVILARTRGGTLQLTIDEIGLKIRAILNRNIPDHVSVYEAVKCRLLDKMSFGFIEDETFDEKDAQNRTITINKIIELTDVSIVDVPAYDCTEVYTRNLESLKAIENLELRKRKLKLKLSI